MKIPKKPEAITRVVVEPHADDAFLSLGTHIERWVKQGDRVVILTVFSGTRKRAVDALAYAHAVGAHWEGLGLDEGPKGTFGDELTIRQALFGMMMELLQGMTVVYLPLGIKNEQHKLVRKACENLRATGHSGERRAAFAVIEVEYYLDQPYASTQSNDAEVNDRLFGMRVESYIQPPARKYRHIPLFRDQSKFFHFNPAEKLKSNIELIVSKRGTL